MKLCRCRWCNLNNKKYIRYHDNVWGRECYDDVLLFKALVLEILSCGISFECALNKEEAISLAFDGFDFNKIAKYDNDSVDRLMANKDIIRHRLKLMAIINNARVFISIRNEYGSFSNYIHSFTKGILYECNLKRSELSDKISKDLKKKGMKFIGSVIIYSYLEAIGIIYSHDSNCYLYKNDRGVN